VYACEITKHSCVFIYSKLQTAIIPSFYQR
jgi:hypothetical protein